MSERISLLLRALQLGASATSPSVNLQRPEYYCRGISSRPWYDTDAFSWCRALEDRASEIRAECMSAWDSRAFAEYREPVPRSTDTVRVHTTGDWHVLYLDFMGRSFEQNRLKCPLTARAIDAIPRRTGVACFSSLAPGTHIPPHCGSFNVTLRCHLALSAPRDARIRVGTETRTWLAGKCLVFDDTFEHEVWGDAHESRVVLLVDFFHPDLSDREVEELRAAWKAPAMARRQADWYRMLGL